MYSRELACREVGRTSVLLLYPMRFVASETEESMRAFKAECKFMRIRDPDKMVFFTPS